MNEEYDHTGMQFRNPASLDELFRQVRAKDEEQLRKRREEVKKQQNSNSVYTVIRYAMYFWVGRMGFSLIGSIIPLLIASWKGGFESTPVYKNNIEKYSWKTLHQSDFSNLREPHMRKTPYLIEEVPVINPSTLKLLISNLFKHHSVPIKVSSHSEFVYFSEKQFWSKELASLQKYDYISIQEYFNDTRYRFPRFRFLDSLRRSVSSSETETEQQQQPSTADNSAENTEKKQPQHYMYISYANIIQYLDSFAPSLYHLSRKAFATSPQCNLWLASPSVTARMHFDYQDNFLLQISGSKQILIVVPEATSWILPYPSLHPLWRQSSQSAQSITQKLFAAKTGPVTTRSNLYHYWNITLRAGEMLYIPSGYYHQVIAEKDSIGINAWFPSPFSEFQLKTTKLPLPFLLDDSLEMKIAKVAIIMKELCFYLREPNMDCLVTYVQQRYQPIFEEVSEKSKQCEVSEDLIYFCKPMENLRMADTFHLNRRIAHDLVMLLDNLDESTASTVRVDTSSLTSISMKEVKYLLILDYIDDLLQLIFDSSSEKSTPHLSVCLMEVLISYCWNYDYLKDDFVN